MISSQATETGDSNNRNSNNNGGGLSQTNKIVVGVVVGVGGSILVGIIAVLFYLKEETTVILKLDGPFGGKMKNWVVMNFSMVNWELEIEILIKDQTFRKITILLKVMFKLVMWFES